MLQIIIAILITTIVSIAGFGHIDRLARENAAKAKHCENLSCVDDKSKTIEPQILTVKPIDVVKTTPVTNVVVEKSYDLKDINDGLLAISGVGGFALVVFIIYKCFGGGRRTIMLSIARRRSLNLISAFDSMVDDVKHCLEHNNRIIEQTYLNDLLIEINKDNPSMNSLILSNQIMKEHYNFIERKILNDFKK